MAGSSSSHTSESAQPVGGKMRREGAGKGDGGGEGAGGGEGGEVAKGEQSEPDQTEDS